MPSCVVVADDLTGANATGVLLKKMNYSAFTVLHPGKIDISLIEDCDCVMYPTDSRGIPRDEAYERVSQVTKHASGEDVKLYAKRIDSTMRGNVGAETDAMLDVLGEDYIAISAACFPSSGRIIIGGYMLVKGLPLHKTEVALDPKCPVHTSDVAEIYRQQSKYKVGNVYMNDMMNGKHKLADKMKALVADGCRIIVCDCVTQEDLDLIADAAITSKLKFITADPGVMTATVARKIIVPFKKAAKTKILAIVGSVNPVTKGQMEELWLTQRTAKNTFVKTALCLEDEETREREIQRVVGEVLEKAQSFDILTVTGDGIYPENRIDFTKYEDRFPGGVEQMTDRINGAFAEIGSRILKADPRFKGLYSSGGDITHEIFKHFNTAGLCLMDEVLPLAAFGKFLNGDFEDVMIITKGGMVGENNAANLCVTYLKEKLYM